MNYGILFSLLTLLLCSSSVANARTKRCLLCIWDPTGIIETGLNIAGETVDAFEGQVGNVVDTVEAIANVGLGGLVNCLANGGLQCVVNNLPSLPNFLPAGPIRRGPYIGVCTCLSNIGGCYIDAAKPPSHGFTCTCIKQEGVFSGRHLACSGIGYKLAWGEENTGGTDDLEQCRNGAKSITAQLSGAIDCGGYMDAFSEQTWAKIQKDVKIRLFAPNSFRPVEEVAGSDGSCGVWEQGEDIYCKLSGGTWGDPQVWLPTSFNPR